MGLISKISRYYLFYGPDEYSKSKKIKALANSVIERGIEEFDYNIFEGRGLDAPTLINVALSPPFGSPLRVVILRDLEKVSPKGLKLIERFIRSIPDFTTFVMTSKKVDKRKPIFKTLFANKKFCINFAEPTPASAAKHILETANELGYKITPETAGYLVETIGCDIGHLEQELDKLALFAGPGETIKKDDIAVASGAGVIGTVYDLPQKIADGDIAGALGLLHNLMLTKQSEGTILFRLKDYFLNLNMVKITNASTWTLTRGKYGYLPKTAESLVRVAKSLSFDCITDCLHCTYEGEINLKSAGLKKNIVLVDLVARLGVVIQRE
jgi:DNA polymerase-3 subunit delta